MSLTPGWLRTLHLGDLKLPFKFTIRSPTNSFKWSFHSASYLMCDFADSANKGHIYWECTNVTLLFSEIFLYDTQKTGNPYFAK